MLHHDLILQLESVVTKVLLPELSQRASIHLLGSIGKFNEKQVEFNVSGYLPSGAEWGCPLPILLEDAAQPGWIDSEVLHANLNSIEQAFKAMISLDESTAASVMPLNYGTYVGKVKSRTSTT